MRRNLLIATGVLVLAGSLILAGCGRNDAVLGAPDGIESVTVSSQQEGIWVSGQGKVSVTPDTATLGLGIEAQDQSVARAQEQAAAAMDSVKTALIDNGVAEKDIQTQFFSIRQVTRWNRETEKEVVTGYRVSNMVSARITDVDSVGTVIDAAAAAGGDFIRINGVSFSVDDPKPFQNEAREQAMEDARSKAEQLARLAGVNLGRPTFISESGFQSPPPYASTMVLERGVAMDMAQSTSINPGELDITLSVQVVYTILP